MLCNGQTLKFYFLTFICLILNLQGCKQFIKFKIDEIIYKDEIKKILMIV
jgi:hypothetical protein